MFWYFPVDIIILHKKLKFFSRRSNVAKKSFHGYCEMTSDTFLMAIIRDYRNQLVLYFLSVVSESAVALPVWLQQHAVPLTNTKFTPYFSQP